MIDRQLTGNRGTAGSARDTSPEPTLALTRTHRYAPRAIAASGSVSDTPDGTTIPDQPSDECVAVARLWCRLRKPGRLRRWQLLRLRVLPLVPLGDRVLEAAEGTAERATHLGQTLGTEDEQDEEPDDQNVPEAENGHTSSLAPADLAAQHPTLGGEEIHPPPTASIAAKFARGRDAAVAMLQLRPLVLEAARRSDRAGTRTSPWRSSLARGGQPSPVEDRYDRLQAQTEFQVISPATPRERGLTNLALLELKDLHVALAEDGTEIVKGVDLAVSTNEVHAVMGPNGSGKSTLAYALMGHPGYEITEGQILLDGDDVTEMGADERASRGLFLAFQYPHAIPGVTVTSFLRAAINSLRKARNGGVDDPVKIPAFRKDLIEAMEQLKVPRELASRYLNDGFSGGEKKRVEILQMAMLKPRIAILDETDSGLDIDALKIVAKGVRSLVGPDMGVLVITHYQRILNYITPDFVHVFVDGRIVEEGGPELAHKLEAEGYEAFMPATVGEEA